MVPPVTFNVGGVGRSISICLLLAAAPSVTRTLPMPIEVNPSSAAWIAAALALNASETLCVPSLISKLPVVAVTVSSVLVRVSLVLVRLPLSATGLSWPCATMVSLSFSLSSPASMTIRPWMPERSLSAGNLTANTSGSTVIGGGVTMRGSGQTSTPYSTVISGMSKEKSM